MWVEVVKSIALKPARSIAGAIASVRGVSMPSAPHRHWLPSRSEVSTIWISAMGPPLGLGLGLGPGAARPALEELRHEIGRHAAGAKLGIVDHPALETDIVRHALD